MRVFPLVRKTLEFRLHYFVCDKMSANNQIAYGGLCSYKFKDFLTLGGKSTSTHNS